jgi:hypothetical protein
VASLEDRGRTLEEEFFREEKRQRIAQRERDRVSPASKKSLREVSGMTDDEILDELIEVGVSAHAISALSLVPLVEVAWADGAIQEREREAILCAALDKGIEKGTAAYALLARWLDTRPEDKLLDAWVAYIHALAEKLTPRQLQNLKGQVVDRARHVGDVAGGFLGLKSVSEAEKRVLARLEAAFERGP